MPVDLTGPRQQTKITSTGKEGAAVINRVTKQLQGALDNVTTQLQGHSSQINKITKQLDGYRFLAGIVTLVAGTATIKFVTPYPNAPIVTLGPHANGNTYGVASTPSQFTITSSSGTDTATLNWIAMLSTAEQAIVG